MNRLRRRSITTSRVRHGEHAALLGAHRPGRVRWKHDDVDRERVAHPRPSPRQCWPEPTIPSRIASRRMGRRRRPSPAYGSSSTVPPYRSTRDLPAAVAPRYESTRPATGSRETERTYYRIPAYGAATPGTAAGAASPRVTVGALPAPAPAAAAERAVSSRPRRPHHHRRRQPNGVTRVVVQSPGASSTAPAPVKPMMSPGDAANVVRRPQ